MQAPFFLVMLLASDTVASKRALNVQLLKSRPLLLAGRFDGALPLRFEIHVGEPRTPSNLCVRFGECRFLFQFSRECRDEGAELLWLLISAENNPRGKTEIYAQQETSGEIDRTLVTFKDYHKHPWSFSCETPEGPVDYEVRGYELPPGFKFEPLERDEELLTEDDWKVAASTSSTRRQLSTTLLSATLTPINPSTQKDYRLSTMLLPHGKNNLKRLLVGSPYFSYLARHF
ncbi:hypothetical protein M3Y99_01952600 [Aphelenchoides fujianensis]|nr:hypothetical protein M3Y99_01952600 [Aphelenchoides fujianensis]